MTVNQESLASSPAMLAKQLQDEMDAVMRHLNSALIHAARLYSGPFSSATRSEEHTSELQSLMRISYAVFCLKKKNKYIIQNIHILTQRHIDVSADRHRI